MSDPKLPAPKNWWVQYRVCEVRDAKDAVAWRCVIFIKPATAGQPTDQIHFLEMNRTAAGVPDADAMADQLASEQGQTRITHRRSETLSCVWHWSDYWHAAFTPAVI
jgi:hypothetical protein